MNANPILNVFELDSDHTFKDRGQTSVRFGIDFGPVVGGSGDIPVSAEIPGVGGPGQPGALVFTVADGGVGLGAARNAGDRLRLTGALPQVSVTDSRTAGGWAVTGHATDLAGGAAGAGGADAASTILSQHLGWAPFLVGGPARPGAAVAASLSGGPGLAVPATLGTGARAAGSAAPAGTAVLGADVVLEVPVDTRAGTYTGAVTVSLFPTD